MEGVVLKYEKGSFGRSGKWVERWLTCDGQRLFVYTSGDRPVRGDGNGKAQQKGKPKNVYFLREIVVAEASGALANKLQRKFVFTVHERSANAKTALLFATTTTHDYTQWIQSLNGIALSSDGSHNNTTTTSSSSSNGTGTETGRKGGRGLNTGTTARRKSTTAQSSATAMGMHTAHTHDEHDALHDAIRSESGESGEAEARSESEHMCRFEFRAFAKECARVQLKLRNSARADAYAGELVSVSDCARVLHRLGVLVGSEMEVPPPGRRGAEEETLIDRMFDQFDTRVLSRVCLDRAAGGSEVEDEYDQPCVDENTFVEFVRSNGIAVGDDLFYMTFHERTAHRRMLAALPEAIDDADVHKCCRAHTFADISVTQQQLQSYGATVAESLGDSLAFAHTFDSAALAREAEATPFLWNARYQSILETHTRKVQEACGVAERMEQAHPRAHAESLFGELIAANMRVGVLMHSFLGAFRVVCTDTVKEFVHSQAGSSFEGLDGTGGEGEGRSFDAEVFVASDDNESEQIFVRSGLVFRVVGVPSSPSAGSPSSAGYERAGDPALSSQSHAFLQRKILKLALKADDLKREALYRTTVRGGAPGAGSVAIVEALRATCGELRVGLGALVDYMGYRVSVHAPVPMDGRSLLYGVVTTDSTAMLVNKLGLSLARDANEGRDGSTASSGMLTAQDLGRAMNLKARLHTLTLVVGGDSGASSPSSRVSKTEAVVPLPMDTSVHLGTDGRKYVMDGRMLPCDMPAAGTSQIHTHTLRHALVTRYAAAAALSPDAFRSSASHRATALPFTYAYANEDHEKRDNRACVCASMHVRCERIPLLARRIDALSIVVYDSASLKSAMHAYGVSVRHLGALHNSCSTAFARDLILCDAIARVCKHLIADVTRKNASRGAGAKAVVCEVLNSILGRRRKDSAEVWHRTVSCGLRSKFGDAFGRVTRAAVHSAQLLAAIAHHCGLELSLPVSASPTEGMTASGAQGRSSAAATSGCAHAHLEGVDLDVPEPLSVDDFEFGVSCVLPRTVAAPWHSVSRLATDCARATMYDGSLKGLEFERLLLSTATPTDVHSLACVELRMAQCCERRQEYARGIIIARDASRLSGNHFALAVRCYTALLRLLFLSGAEGEAVDWSRCAMRFADWALGAAHPLVVGMAVECADGLVGVGKYAEGVVALRDALERSERGLGATHALTIAICVKGGTLRLAVGDIRGARATAERARSALIRAQREENTQDVGALGDCEAQLVALESKLLASSGPTSAGGVGLAPASKSGVAEKEARSTAEGLMEVGIDGSWGPPW